MPQQNGHIHKLQRHRFKTGNVVYFCVDDCNYKISVALALGKRSRCWRCGNEFTMSEYSIRLAKPHCNACHKPKGVNQHTDFPATTIEQLNKEWVHAPSPVEREATTDLMSRLRTVTKSIGDEEDI